MYRSTRVPGDQIFPSLFASCGGCGGIKHRVAEVILPSLTLDPLLELAGLLPSRLLFFHNSRVASEEAGWGEKKQQK